jgi:hypothetical protein
MNDFASMDRLEQQRALDLLEREHTALDKEIASNVTSIGFDQSALKYKKKRKLEIKDTISSLSNELSP